MGERLEELGEGQVTVLYARPGELRGGAQTARLCGLLSDEERQRYQRFRFDRDRRQYLVAHALLRTTLAGYLGRPPESLTFAVAAHGKPELASEGAAGLRFNLSHTEGLVACAVAWGVAIGVDVEHEDRRTALDEVAARVFSLHEQGCLRDLPEPARRRRFFQYWTLKESYIKAVGKGLAMPLRSITFLLDEGSEPRVRFDAPIEDHPDDWRFVTFRPSERHPLAVAVHSQAPVQVRMSASTLLTDPA